MSERCAPRWGIDIMMSSRYHHDVRTTLTLDDDVAQKLADEARRTRRSFKAVVNEALRLGLLQQHSGSPQPFRVRARRLGLREGMDLADIESLLDRLDGAARR
uniref:Ribbon-helix-helix protein CopG domain-containing protein n=1 Tax=mine drainage metagenome TaxID=410659 RepID=E6PGZ6_9ZZZZ